MKLTIQVTITQNNNVSCSLKNYNLQGLTMVASSKLSKYTNGGSALQGAPSFPIRET